MLERQGVEVTTSGELVVLRIGNFTRALHFVLALQLARQLLEDGRIARRLAGVKHPQVRIGGALEDDREVPPSRWGGKCPPLVRTVSTRAQRGAVEFKLDKDGGSIGWDSALTLSQWLRVRGRQAAAHAGERAHWSELTSPAA